MRNLIMVAFIEPVAVGQEFLRSDWPLHVTLVRFDVGNDGDAARFAALAEMPAKQALGTVLAVGGEDRFGRQGSVPVSLVETDPALQMLHDSLVQAVQQVSGRVASPQYTRRNFRPHVSHHGDRRVHRGDAVVLDQIALVDMAPDGNHTIRRILELWELRK
ncbi:2'-5' RNA ligase family protein [Arthrobacter sp. ISL-5]|uniref:2'-5' RNA ligase family protein n=1 Tax=Arthrobacter sp. ISL-5 TaxID=2819111 RepID=UPI001BE841CF|nr:2'-5' RNA ligase family protein [Arthrobacter sp. ISL-5]MBT2552635.1 2'-5' RNA ligase family protein [Arthrobacter sp. ISL-5]